MFSSADLLRLQKEQHRHDCRNHGDIHSLHKTDRLKHYGLHFCKYVGRLARGASESKTLDRTLTDTFLVSLSAANTLHQDLSQSGGSSGDHVATNDPLYAFADAAGRFADACEKIDHLEEFTTMARTANYDIIQWVRSMAEERHVDLAPLVTERRKQLAARQFYIED